MTAWLTDLSESLAPAASPIVPQPASDRTGSILEALWDLTPLSGPVNAAVALLSSTPPMSRGNEDAQRAQIRAIIDSYYFPTRDQDVEAWNNRWVNERMTEASMRAALTPQIGSPASRKFVIDTYAQAGNALTITQVGDPGLDVVRETAKQLDAGTIGPDRVRQLAMSSAIPQSSAVSSLPAIRSAPPSVSAIVPTLTAPGGQVTSDTMSAVVPQGASVNNAASPLATNAPTPGPAADAPDRKKLYLVVALAVAAWLFL